MPSPPKPAERPRTDTYLATAAELEVRIHKYFGKHVLPACGQHPPKMREIGGGHAPGPPGASVLGTQYRRNALAGSSISTAQNPSNVEPLESPKKGASSQIKIIIFFHLPILGP